MGRFTSTDTIEYDRLFQQAGECAGCGKALIKESRSHGERGAWEAHHIDGNSKNNTVRNCAVLCINDPENCHLNLAHGGDYTDGVLAPRSAFTLRRGSIFY